MYLDWCVFFAIFCTKREWRNICARARRGQAEPNETEKEKRRELDGGHVTLSIQQHSATGR
jgi:hypothetical protein